MATSSSGCPTEPTQLTSDRPSVDAEGQSWCGACESIEGPWRMNKAWMTHAPAVGFLAATVGPITARPRDPGSPAHETQQFRPAPLKCRPLPAGASDVIPWTAASNIPPTIHHLPAGLLVSVFSRPAPSAEYWGKQGPSIASALPG